MIEIWHRDNFDKPLVEAKRPTLVARGDEMGICFRGYEVEVDAQFITNLVVKAFREGVIFDREAEDRIIKAMGRDVSTF